MVRYMLIKSRLKSGKRRYLDFFIEFSGGTAVIIKKKMVEETQFYSKLD